MFELSKFMSKCLIERRRPCELWLCTGKTQFWVCTVTASNSIRIKHAMSSICLTKLDFDLVSDASYFENKLLGDLFNKYNKNVRPVVNDNDAVIVTMGLSLHQIMDVVSIVVFTLLI